MFTDTTLPYILANTQHIQTHISMNTNFGKIWQKIKTDTSVESGTY